jgi:O-antigen ligase
MLQKITHLTSCLIILALPLYLIRFKIGWIPVTLLELMIYGLFLLWLIQKMLDAKGLTFSISYPILLIFLGATLSTLLSIDIQTSAGIWKGWFLAPLLFLIVLVDNLKSVKRIKNVILALFLSGTGVSLTAFFYWLNNNLTYDGRLQAFYLSPNHLAMYLSPCLIIGFALWRLMERKWQRIFLATCYILYATCIYLTYSFGAWLGILSALIFIIITSGQKKKTVACLLTGLALLLLICVLFNQTANQKLQSLLDFSYPSLKSRLIIWQSGWEIIKDHSLIGIGPGMFQRYYLDYQDRFRPYLEWAAPQPHNIFLAFWLQTGLLGLFGFIWLMTIFLKQIIHSQIQNIKYEMLNTILFAAILYTLIHGLVDTPYWKNDLAIVFWLIIALNCKAGRLFAPQKADNLPKKAELIL